MDSLTYDQSMDLTALIYCDGFRDAVEKDNVNNVGEMVGYLKKEIDEREQANKNYEYNVMMSKERWEKLLDKIGNDETLSRLEFDSENFADETEYNTESNRASESIMSSEVSGFRAIVFTDPDKNINNTVVFRGSASHWQWHDNFAPLSGIAVSPQQHKAKQYMANLQMMNLDVAGHSKGGNLAESMAYMLPDGMVNRSLSYDGQRFSKEFLELFPPGVRSAAEKKTVNINHINDTVHRLFLENMPNTHSINFATSTKYPVRFFHHMPDEHLYSTGAGYLDSDQDAEIRNLIQNALASQDLTNGVLWLLGKAMPKGWTEADYLAAKSADAVYQEMVLYRTVNLMLLFYGHFEMDPNDYFEDKQDSEVVDGAIIYCDYGDVLGELKLPVSHGKMTRGKPVLNTKDSKAGVNVIFKDGRCFPTIAATINKLAQNAEKDADLTGTSEPCIPNLDEREWLIADDNKVVSSGGSSVRTLLLKSVLVCQKGGVIYIAHNGQM